MPKFGVFTQSGAPADRRATGRASGERQWAATAERRVVRRQGTICYHHRMAKCGGKEQRPWLSCLSGASW
jgi:hypothetical protein